MSKKRPLHQIRVLAVASSGGHWVQLRRLMPAWDGCQVTYVSTSESRRKEVVSESKIPDGKGPSFYLVVDATRWEKIKLLKQLWQILKIVIWVRPHVVISTGAAPGYFALKIGKFFGSKTIWVDSIANAKNLSLAGEKAGGCADLWLTQWEHLAVTSNGKKNLRYEGTVL